MSDTKIAIISILLISMFSIFAVGFWKIDGKDLVIASAAVSGLTGFIGGWAYGKHQIGNITPPVKEDKSGVS